MFFVVAISVFGLHFIIEIWMCGSFVGGGMNLVSLACAGVTCVFTMFV